MDFSVVITTYNRPDYLELSLRSVLAQQVQPEEIIIVDDNSSKSYKEVLAKFDDVKIKYLKQPSSGGANVARNRGIKESHSDVVAFLDDDDIWLPEYLAHHQEKYLNGAEAVVSGFKHLGDESKVKVNKDSKVTKHSLLRGNHYCGMSGFSAKRELLEEMLFDETLNNGQDWDMYVRLFERNVSFININIPIFLYRFQNEDGIGAKVRKMKPSDIDKRLGSAYKHKVFLGDYWFKKRVCEQILFSLKYKNEKSRWIIQALKMAGFRATFVFFYNALKRKVLNKPMSI